MPNRFYTILVVPEKTSQVKRFTVPAWVVRGSLVGLFFVVAISTIMLLDYWYVMGQIGENKQLKIENRRLKQQVQVFRNKMATIEGTMDRIKTFSTRLKVITNIEDRDNLIQSLNEKLPDAATNVGSNATGTDENAEAENSDGEDTGTKAAQAAPGAAKARPISSITSDETWQRAWENFTDQWENGMERAETIKAFNDLDDEFSRLNYESLLVEQTLQDQYELLADQKAFLAALPTRKPAVGYFTSGFGVRRSPYGGREKMHEGLDIANRPGTAIRAPADGTVIFAETKAGYGQTLIIDHGYGLETWYGHTRKILVKRGQKVRRGDTVALLGNTGRSTGPHVHYEVRVHGTPVDPLTYILEN